MDTLLPAERSLLAYALRSGLRVGDFFKNFDKLHSGRVSASQFRRALSSLGVTLSEEDSQALISKYSDMNDGFVNYRAFASIIDTGTILTFSLAYCTCSTSKPDL